MSMTTSLAATGAPTTDKPPLFEYLKSRFSAHGEHSDYFLSTRRERGNTRRTNLQKQVADLKKQLKAVQGPLEAKKLDKQRHVMFNANPLCSCCSGEMTIRNKQKNTARLIGGKLVCETCIQWGEGKKIKTETEGLSA